MVTSSLIKELKSSSGKKTAFSRYGARSVGGQYEDDCKSIPSYLPVQTQVQVDQEPIHKTRYTESNGRESGEEPRTHSHREKFSEKNIIDLCSKITNRQIDLIKLQSFCKADDPVNRTKQQPPELKKIFTNPT